VLKAIIAKLEDANENVRSLYRAGTAEEGTEGKFVLDVEPADGFTLENVDGLKSALSAERTAHGQAKAKVKAFDGLDPEVARAAIAKVEELKDLDPKKDVDRIVEEKVGAQLTQLNDRHQSELTALNKRIARRDALLKKTLVEDQALKAIVAEKGDPDLLLPHVLPSIQLELEDDDEADRIQPKVKVLDAAGNVRIGDSAGNPMKIEGLVGELKKHDKFSRLFEGDGVEGTGDGDGGGDRHRRNSDHGGKKLSQLSRKDKAKLIGEIGLEKFQERVQQESLEAAE
jgi:hypothetical protein